MLSLDRCREILGKSIEISNMELEVMLAQMYALADIMIMTMNMNIYLFAHRPFENIIVDEFVVVTVVGGCHA